MNPKLILTACFAAAVLPYRGGCDLTNPLNTYAGTTPADPQAQRTFFRS